MRDVICYQLKGHHNGKSPAFAINSDRGGQLGRAFVWWAVAAISEVSIAALVVWWLARRLADGLVNAMF